MTDQIVNEGAGISGADTARRISLNWQTMKERVALSPGAWSALPVTLLLIGGFFGPLLLVLVYSFMPRGTFSPLGQPTLENYRDIVDQNFYISFSWSIVLAVVSTVLLLESAILLR